MTYDFVLIEHKDRVGYLTLNRPDKLNAMPRQMYLEISRALVELEAMPEVWVIVVRGAGERAFSAGADLSLLHGALTSGPFQWEPYRPQRFDMGLQVAKPVIAAIHGDCLAGGMELALGCDIRIASEDATFGAPEVRWSVLHGFGALVMPQLTSLGAAMEILLTGDRFSAAEAHRLGIVNKVVKREELAQAVDDLAARICRNGPIAVRMTKELVLRGRELSLQDGLRLYREYNKLIHLTEDAVEGSRAWEEQREPNYVGR
jgi:enoyl-CoA hydratase/carnithine racemase